MGNFATKLDKRCYSNFCRNSKSRELVEKKEVEIVWHVNFAVNLIFHCFNLKLELNDYLCVIVDRGSIRGSHEYGEIASTNAHLCDKNDNETVSFNGTKSGGNESLGRRRFHRSRGIPRIRR